MNETEVDVLVKNAVTQSKLRLKEITNCTILHKGVDFYLVSTNVLTQDGRSNELLLTVQKLSQTIYLNEKDVIEAQTQTYNKGNFVNNAINQTAKLFQQLVVELRELHGIMRLLGIIAVGLLVLLLIFTAMGFRTDSQQWSSNFAIVFSLLVGLFSAVLAAILLCHVYATRALMHPQVTLNPNDAQTLLKFAFQLENLENDSEKTVEELKKMNDELECHSIDSVKTLFRLRESLLGGLITRWCRYTSKQETIDTISKLYDIIRKLPSKNQA